MYRCNSCNSMVLVQSSGIQLSSGRYCKTCGQQIEIELKERKERKLAEELRTEKLRREEEERKKEKLAEKQRLAAERREERERRKKEREMKRLESQRIEESESRKKEKELAEKQRLAAERREEREMRKKEREEKIALENARLEEKIQEEEKKVQQFRKDLESELSTDGLKPLSCEDLPIRLKRNEKVYLLGSITKKSMKYIGFVLTSNRLLVFNEYRRGCFGHRYPVINPIGLVKKASPALEIMPGIQSIKLSSIISIDTPTRGDKYWKISIHRENGANEQLSFSTGRYAQTSSLMISELVDRINDPIDESVFSPKRERISDEIKITVWRRDEGRCVRCGSRNNLEYDHIIPVSKGGANTIRNIELLCEACNRKKSNKIL